MNNLNQLLWPELPYDKFSSTSYLLHRGLQAIGKLKLLTPFEPEWANVILYITARGLTTGLIPYQQHAFAIDIDLIEHQIITYSTSGLHDKFDLKTMSVADLFNKIFASLKNIDIELTINPKPQEVPNPILFNEDTESRDYDKKLAQAWWQILVNTYLVMQFYHAPFLGKTQPIGFMWGTFDLRDVRFKDCSINTPTSGPNAGYLRRNAMDAAQVESGWWSGNEQYPRAAYYSFTFPEPPGIEKAAIQPRRAHWDNNLKLFILDYDDMRQAENPAEELLMFLKSSYQAGAEKAGWDAKLIGVGEPV